MYLRVSSGQQEQEHGVALPCMIEENVTLLIIFINEIQSSKVNISELRSEIDWDRNGLRLFHLI